MSCVHLSTEVVMFSMLRRHSDMACKYSFYDNVCSACNQLILAVSEGAYRRECIISKRRGELELIGIVSIENETQIALLDIEGEERCLN